MSLWCLLIFTVVGVAYGTKFNVLDCAKYGSGYYVFGCNTTYWTCLGLYSHKFSCYGELVFDPDRIECNYRDQTRICNEPGVQLTVPYRGVELFTCNGKHDGLYSTGFCDAKFYTCNNGTQHDQTCPLDQFFDNDLKRCEFRDIILECQPDKLKPRPLAQPAQPRKNWSFPPSDNLNQPLPNAQQVLNNGYKF